MSNMSYCRFENTKGDLENCVDHMTDPLSPAEHRARDAIIQMAYDIVSLNDRGEIPEESRDD